MDVAGVSQFRRKPVPGPSQPFSAPSPGPEIPGCREDVQERVRETNVNQLSVQTSGLAITSGVGIYQGKEQDSRPALPPRTPTPQPEKAPTCMLVTNHKELLFPSAPQYGTRSTSLTVQTSVKSTRDQPDGETRPAPPPRIRTLEPEASSSSTTKGYRSPVPSPGRSPTFCPYVTSPGSLTPSCDPPPYSFLNPHTQTQTPTQAHRPPLRPPQAQSSLVALPATPTTQSTGSKIWQSALETTKDFALNILPQSTTITKHYTILLHGSPLIVYRGPATSLTITIFSSPKYPLPPPEHRVLYLQPRGFSGDTGSKIKAFVGATEDWINVTPDIRADSRDVDPALSKRWDKDIARTSKRLRKEFKEGKVHVVRETHAIRVPAMAEDGYFRVVVCHKEEGQKRKILCAGPLVRIASLSSDSSVFRGAKVRTLPLELSLSAASMVATGYVATVTGPVTEVVQNQVQRVMPGAAAMLAYDTLMADTVDETTDEIRAATYQAYAAEHGRGTDVIGPDEGPEKPFPVRFQGKVVPGTGEGTERLGIPTANLKDVPEDTKNHLKGVYFGWASIRDTTGVDPDWHEAIIFVGPSPFAPPSVITKIVIAVHLLHSFDGEAPFFGAKMSVVVMGFLRPTQFPGKPVEQMLDAVSQDLWLTMSSLSRPNWSPHAGAEAERPGIRVLTKATTFSDKIVATKDKVQTKIDKLPAHWVGVRTTGAEVRDQLHGNGGYWISR